MREFNVNNKYKEETNKQRKSLKAPLTEFCFIGI